MKEEIKELLKNSSFWTCNVDDNIVLINLENATNAIIKANLEHPNQSSKDEYPEKI